MHLTNNWGKTVKCIVCQSEEIEDYKIHHPPFADAMNSVHIAWCKSHEDEGIEKYNNAENNSMDIKSCGSHS